MKEIPLEEWHHLNENFETTSLLDAVKKIDKLRYFLSDNENFGPPQIRDDLLKLHQFAMDVVNYGRMEHAQELFEMADGLEMQISDIIEELENIQQTLNRLVDLYPKSLADFY